MKLKPRLHHLLVANDKGGASKSTCADVLAYRFSKGDLTVEELRQHAKQHTPKYTR